MTKSRIVFLFVCVVVLVAPTAKADGGAPLAATYAPPFRPLIPPCDGLNEPHAYANVATETPFSTSSSDYYEAYLRLSDNSGNYIQIHVKRTPTDQGVMKVIGRSHDSSGTFDSTADNFTTAPNLELRYNSVSGAWEAYDGSRVLKSQFLSVVGSKTREFGVTVYPNTTYCPSVSATFTSTDPAASGLTYADDGNYHVTQLSSTSLRVTGPSS